MDGLEAMEINLSVCKEIIDFRIDASTYTKEYVRTDKLLKKLQAKTINDNMTDIQNFGAYSLCSYINFVDDGIPFLMTQNVRHNYIDWNNIRYVDEASHKMLYKSHCSENQVLVTMAGEYLGRVAVYNKDFICSSNQAIAKVTLKDGISPYYFSTYLNSKYGQNQINRFKTITGQPNINMSLIKALMIPDASKTLSDKIESIVISANDSRQKAMELFSEAEKNFIQILSFDTFTDPKEVSTVKRFSESFGISGRIDAEYYQSKYDDLFNRLKAFNCKKLKKIVDIKKSIEPGSEFYVDDGIPFVRVSDIDKFGISEPPIRLPNDIEKNVQLLFPKKNTILLTKDGSCGIAYKMKEDSEVITSSAILHLTVKDVNEILPDYLVLVINSSIVRLQAERDAGGSIIQHWKPSEIGEVLIPIIDIQMQKELVDQIQEAFVLLKESDIKLKKAINIVEKAIEQSKPGAIEFFDLIE